MTTRVAIVGAMGRMGTLVTRLVEAAPDFDVVARIDSRGELSEMLDADVVVDVTVPEVSPIVVDYAIAHGVSVLVGTSGWTSERIAALEKKITGNLSVGVIIIPNFSLGSVLASAFAAMAGRFFDSIEIVEAHGATKIDSPSGTAIRTAELISAARSDLGQLGAAHVDQRARGQQVAGIPVHSLRLNGVVAKQDVLLGGRGELLSISHETVSPIAYEAGILLALRALASTRGVIVGLDKLLDFDFGAGRDAK